MADQPVSEGIRALLATHVATSGWALETGMLPTTPDKVISLADTGGQPSNPKWLLDYPQLQVTVRGAVGGYIAAFAEAKAVKDIILGLPSQTINDDIWDGVLMTSDVAFIGKDENERPIFTANFNLIIEPALVANSNRVALNK